MSDGIASDPCPTTCRRGSATSQYAETARLPRRAGLHVDVVRVGRERQPAVLGRRGRRRAHRRADRAADDAVAVVPPPPLAAGPDRAQRLPLQVHFDLKERLGLPEAVMSDNTIIFHDPVRPGDVISTAQVLRSVSEPKTTKLGTGRFWVIDVAVPQPARRAGRASRRTPASATADAAAATASTVRRPAVDDAEPTRPPRVAASVLGDALATRCPTWPTTSTATTVVLGALATRDWRPMHHDHDFAVNRNGAQRHLPQHAQPGGLVRALRHRLDRARGRLGRMRFRMRDSVFPGDTMMLTGTRRRRRDRRRRVRLGDGGHRGAWPASRHACAPRPACASPLPTAADDNPWRRRGDHWTP